MQVNSVIAITAEEGDDLSGADKLAAEAESDTPAPASSSEEAKEEPEPKKEEKAPEPSSSSSSAPSSSEAPSDKPADRIFASPLARKMAQEKGIPLAQIKGSGPNGRITKTDVESYKPSSAPSSSQPAASPSAGKAAAPSAPRA